MDKLFGIGMNAGVVLLAGRYIINTYTKAMKEAMAAFSAEMQHERDAHRHETQMLVNAMDRLPRCGYDR